MIVNEKLLKLARLLSFEGYFRELTDSRVDPVDDFSPLNLVFE
jgi:hypothetical protein